MLNSRGQEFAGYRLLIGAITALLILVIILGIINHIENIKFQISERQLYEGLNAAVQTPDETQVVRKDLTLKNGSAFSSEAFSTRAGIPAECIRIDSSTSSAFEVSTNNKMIAIKTNIMTDVYYKCIKPGELAGCTDTEDISCEISFGKETS